MISLTSNSLAMMEQSMNFLWAKQAAHLDNIANAETPGYRVKTVTFEVQFNQKLLEAAQERQPRAQMRQVIADADWRVNEDSAFTRLDENGVNITEQSLEAVRTAYQIQYVMQAISNDFTLLGTAIGAS